MQAGIAHLAQWNFGDKTTAAAFVNEELYEQLQAGEWNRRFEADGYVLTYNPQMGYVGLVQEHPEPTSTHGEDVVAARDAFSGVASKTPRHAMRAGTVSLRLCRWVSSAVGRSL